MRYFPVLLCLFVGFFSCEPPIVVIGDLENCDASSILPDYNDASPPTGRFEVTVSPLTSGTPAEVTYDVILPSFYPIYVNPGDQVDVRYFAEDIESGVKSMRFTLDLDYSCDLTQDLLIGDTDTDVLLYEYADASPFIRCVPFQHESHLISVHVAADCVGDGVTNPSGSYRFYGAAGNYAGIDQTFILDLIVVPAGQQIIF
ncbi:MAG: hypothetical protein AAFN92_08010 [Bacteroidota bacterium]